MRKTKTVNGEIIGISFVVDTLITWLSYYLSVWLRFTVMKGTDSAKMTGSVMLALFLVYSVLVGAALLIAKIHDITSFGEKGKVTQIVLINTVCVVMIVIMLFIFHIDNFSRIALLFFWLISTSCLVLSFWGEKQVIAKKWDKISAKKSVVIVGNGEVARKYIEGVKEQELSLVDVCGYVGYEKKGLGTYLGKYEDLGSVLEKMDPDELVVALEPHETEHMKRIISVAEKEGIGIQLIPLFNEYIPQHPVVETVGEVSLINLRSTPLNNEWNAFIKRSIDIVGSFLLLVLFSPLMLVTAIGVRLSSPGPILFCQNRVGRGKKEFKMYKFRSMRINNEEESGWSRDKDPRRTAFGTFIRKYSIDELPQLINVLKGDMSLVGPRPEIPFYVRQFKESIPLYLVRQQIRPGMTGLAQINGLRGDTSIETRVKYDIWYIENWSLGLDIQILLKTAFGGFINNEH